MLISSFFSSLPGYIPEVGWSLTGYLSGCADKSGMKPTPIVDFRNNRHFHNSISL